MPDLWPGHLTPDERTKLRPTVDIAALEQFLQQAPVAWRSLTLLHFAQRWPARDVYAALQEAGVDDRDLADVRDLAEYAPDPPHLAHPENDEDPTWVRPQIELATFRATPPLDSEPLRLLWEAIEPQAEPDQYRDRAV